MKKIIAMLIACILFTPCMTYAASQARDLLETFEVASIEPRVDDYKENKEQVVIYMFWADYCEHCHDALEFLNEILPEYKDKIKLRSYEVSNNTYNATIHKKVASWFEITKTGVPLIVIGESTFYGFQRNDTDEKMKLAIDDVYSQTPEERYDVFEEIEKGKQPEEKKKNILLILLIPLVIVSIGAYVFIQFKKQNNKR